MNKNYTIVTSQKDYEKLVAHIYNYEYFGFDTETTGLVTRRDQVIGASISGKAGESYYIPYLTWDKQKQELVRVWELAKFLHIINLLKEKDLLTWNGSYDMRIVKHSLGIDLLGSLIADGQLMKHTVQEEGFFALKKTAIELQDILGIDAEEEANKEQLELKANVIANGGRWTKEQKDMYMADLEVMGPYACADADYTFRLCEYYSHKIAEEDLNEFFFDEEVMPLYKTVTIPMEDMGVKLDLDLINETNESLIKDMEMLHSEVIEELLAQDATQKWLDFVSSEKFPAKKSGNFGQAVVAYFELPLPISEKSGKYMMGKKVVEKMEEGPVKDFLLGDATALSQEVATEIQRQLWFDREGSYINISSKKQMGEIVFDFMKIKPLSKTDKGAPQFDDGMIQHLAEELGFGWAKKLSNYNKLVKIKGTYIDRFLDNHYEGRYYFGYKQYGTISGRYGSDAQQLPRPKEEGELDEIVLKYNNIIRKFFIAEEGRCFIDCDYESLEPHVFAHVSGDEGLRDIFRKGHDFYSTIAIATENLTEVSADKKADNYLGKVNKPLRQSAKAYSLGVPYGMSAYALGKTLEIPKKDAKEKVEGYLSGFPNLKKWMEESEEFVKANGFIRTETGRIRHLPRVKELHRRYGNKLMDFKFRKRLERRFGEKEVKAMYMDYKNGLNNSKNVQIQGLSASIVNRAAIAVTLAFQEKGIDGYVTAQIHDQLIFNVAESQKEQALEIVKDCMENNYKLSIKLKAPPELGKNWQEAH